MTTGMVNLQNCPRDVENLLQIKRGIRYRLGLQIQMFSNNNEEQGFLSATDEVQAQGLSAALQAYDANGGGSNGQAAAVPQQPLAAAPTPAMPPQPAAPAMPPPIQQPQMPMNMQVVGNQQVMQPAQPAQPAMPQQPQMPAQPQQPQMPAQQPVMQPAPQQIAQPVAPPPQPQMPSQPVAAPPPQPVTASDPSNAGSTLGASIPQKLDGMVKALKKVAEVGESNQEWIEEIHDHSLGNSRVLHTLLLLQLTLAEQQGLDTNMLVKLMLSKDPETVETFLGNFAEEEEEEEGKG